MEHTNTLCGQNIEFWYVKAGGTHRYHWILKDHLPFIFGLQRSITKKYEYKQKPKKINKKIIPTYT
jgi:hypothetical protein